MFGDLPINSSRFRGITGSAWLLLLGFTPLFSSSPCHSQTPPPAQAVVTITAPSPVIYEENPDVVQRLAVDPSRAEKMVDAAILKLTSSSDIGTAWTRLGITPNDIVGVKISTAGGTIMATHRPIIRAICNGLHAAGVPFEHIILWDKSGSTMAMAGFQLTAGLPTRVAITNVFPSTGYDSEVIYKSELSGELIWGDSEFVRGDESDLMQSVQSALERQNPGSHINNDQRQSSTASHFANLVTKICTKIVNVPVLTDSDGLGINGCLASLAVASVDNNRRFQGPPTYGDPAIGEILSQPFFRRKVVLNVLDAMIMQYAGGPDFNPQFCVPLGALYVGRDAVAIDTLALPRLEAWRKTHHVDPIGRTAAHVHGCTYPHLGTDDLHNIELIKL